MNNVIEYKDGASFSGFSAGWETKVEAGKGRAYGVELCVEKKAGRLTGTIAYALGKTERKFTDINYGEWFPAKFDRRHTANISLNYQLSKKVNAILNWTYASGNMMTIPFMTAEIPEIPNTMGKPEGLAQLENRNNYRMTSHHRLDIGGKFIPRKGHQRYGRGACSVYNA